ncbi:MAG TPA: Do family serine endopeptidase [Tepidisphaeraceae bacterium]
MKLMRSGFGVAVLSLSALTAGYYVGRPLLEHVEFARAEADVDATRQQLSTVEDLSTVFRHVGKVVEPSVVNIRVRKTVKETSSRMPEQQLRRFFQQHGGETPFDFNDADPNNDQPMEEIGTGSGVIMDAEGGYGYILTNNHVAGDANEMEVTLSDGRKFSGHDVKLIGADAKQDLAVVQIKADRLIAAKWGDSDELEKGDWVMAFGSPFGYVGSMTHGIVSALNRNQVIPNKEDYENFIQVDAPINPGNSGGPLVNMHGEVVGINTAIATVSGGFQGIGFAIPSNEAKIVYTALREHGKVVRGWLGVSIKSVSDDPDTAKFFGYQGDTGVMVVQTFAGTPASGKLHKGDVIIGFNDKPVTDVSQLRNRVADTEPNTEVTLRVSRNGKEQDVKITLGDQPEDVTAMLGHTDNGAGNGSADDSAQTPEAFGMTFKTLDPDTAASLGIGDVKSGAVIMSVTNDSAAALAGLQKGFVITEVGRTPVHNAQEAADLLKKVDPAKGVPLYVVTREGSQFVFLKSDSQK